MITRMSHLFLRTLRDDPADAEVPSHKLLVRAGYVRRVAPGVYSWLPLGLKVLRRVEDVVRKEMNAIGGQELMFPALLPREPYQTTGRWAEYGDRTVSPRVIALAAAMRNQTSIVTMASPAPPGLSATMQCSA